MTQQSERPTNLDESHVTIIGHISIRDPDSGEVIRRQRDTNLEKATNGHDD